MLTLPSQAQTGNEWATYDRVFENGARQAQWWEAGWSGIYAASLVVDAYQSSEASSRDDRFDARIGVVKSALALAIANVIGAQVGARMAINRGSGFVRVVLLVVVVAMVGKLAYDMIAG